MRDGFLAVVTGQGSLSKAPARAGRDERAKRDQARVSPRRTRLDSRWGRRGQAKASRTLPKATLQRRRGTECGRRASEGLFWPNAACSNQPASTEGDRGQVAEWLNAPHSKCGIPARVSGVQIPPCPPSSRSGIDPKRVLKNQWLAAARVVHTGGAQWLSQCRAPGSIPRPASTGFASASRASSAPCSARPRRSRASEPVIRPRPSSSRRRCSSPSRSAGPT